MYIQLKKDSDIHKMNTVLEGLGIKSKFITVEDNEEWLKDINENPNSPQKHLKPTDRPLLMDELVEIMPLWTQVGLFHSDLYYGRTSEKDMKNIAKFVNENHNFVEYIKNADLLIERGKISNKYQNVLRQLNKDDDEPEKLPQEEQHIPDLNGGLLLAKSFSVKPFWVIFGNVTRPSFLKTKIYKEDIYNDLYRDSQGYGYMMLPLYDSSSNFSEKVLEAAWNIGLREEPNFFMAYIYKFLFDDVKSVAQSFAEFYNEEELLERLKLVYNNLSFELMTIHKMYSFTIGNNGLVKVEGLRSNSLVTNNIKLMNALLLALKSKDKSKKLVNISSNESEVTFHFNSHTAVI